MARKTGDPCTAGEFTVQVRVSENTQGNVGTYAFTLEWAAPFTWVAAADGGDGFDAPPAVSLGVRRADVVGVNSLSRLRNGVLFTATFTSAGGVTGEVAAVLVRFVGFGQTPLGDTLLQPIAHVMFNETTLACGAVGTPTVTPRCVCAVPPATGDYDNDALPDGVEYDQPGPGQSNRYLWDSDGDGLSDGFEDRNANGIQDAGETGTRRRDTDGDGVWDGVEIILLGTNPMDPAVPANTSDNDQDGLPAVVDLDDADLDADNDRITDGMEAVLCGLLASGDPQVRSPFADGNCDGFVTNLDALAAQSLFVGTIPRANIPGAVNLDVNRDAAVTNLDGLIIQTWFLVLPAVPAIPVPSF